MPEDKLKEALLKKILEDFDVSGEFYQKSFKETFKVNVEVDSKKGYQIFEPDKYSSKFGEHVEDPDVTITFRDINYVKGMLQGEKLGTEWRRDTKDVRHMNKKAILVSTRTRNNEGNAQVLIAKIPFFDPVVKNFGTSRQARPLRDEPEPIGPVEKGEIASLMKKMLNESVDVSDE
ncbi:MAG: hypothetical protein ACXAEX_16870, partial [Promethearchaeota archaeon]